MRARKIMLVGAVAALTLGATAAAGALVGSASHAAGGQLGIQTLVGEGNWATQSKAWVPVPGATTNFTIPGPASALVVATFSAEAGCRGPSGSFCSVRIMVDSTQMNPQSGATFAFASSTSTTNFNWTGASMQRSIVAGPGTHTISVQYQTNPSATEAWLGDWQLTTTENSGVTH